MEMERAPLSPYEQPQPIYTMRVQIWSAILGWCLASWACTEWCKCLYQGTWISDTKRQNNKWTICRQNGTTSIFNKFLIRQFSNKFSGCGDLHWVNFLRCPHEKTKGMMQKAQLEENDWCLFTRKPGVEVSSHSGDLLLLFGSITWISIPPQTPGIVQTLILSFVSSE